MIRIKAVKGCCSTMRRMATVTLCLVLVAAGLVDVVSHTAHAGHFHDTHGKTAQFLGIENHGVSSEALSDIDDNQASADTPALEARWHHGDAPSGDDEFNGCDAHLCMAAIVIDAIDVAAHLKIVRHAPIVDAIAPSLEIKGLYRPPISVL